MIGSRVSPDVMDASTLPPVYDRFAATVVRQSSVEPMVTELVRLRCAQYHDCRLCGSARLVAAVHAGLSEDMVVMLGDYESTDWCSRWKTALRLTDAVIINPTNIPDGLRSDVRSHFTDEQLSELLFDIVKWSYQKALVSLRLETPLVDGIGDLVFEEDGRLVVTPHEQPAKTVA